MFKSKNIRCGYSCGRVLFIPNRHVTRRCAMQTQIGRKAHAFLPQKRTRGTVSAPSPIQDLASAQRAFILCWPLVGCVSVSVDAPFFRGVRKEVGKFKPHRITDHRRLLENMITSSVSAAFRALPIWLTTSSHSCERKRPRWRPIVHQAQPSITNPAALVARQSCFALAVHMCRSLSELLVLMCFRLSKVARKRSQAGLVRFGSSAARIVFGSVSAPAVAPLWEKAHALLASRRQTASQAARR